MTDETPTPAPTPDPAPAPDPNPTPDPAVPNPTPDPAPDPAPTPDPASNGEANFALPDEYKDKPWAAKIKSQDDLFKQLDNAQTLIGKKTVQPIDYATATPEQIAEHHAKLAPESPDAYDFGEGADPELSKQFGEMFKELGINEYQGKNLAAKVSELAVKMVEAKNAEAADGQKYLDALKESFGDKSPQVAKFLDDKIKEYANEKDVALLRDGIPNDMRLALDRTIYNILQKHGVTETGAAAEGGNGAPPAGDINAQRADLRKQIRELDGKPHTVAEKQALINKLNATYPSGK